MLRHLKESPVCGTRPPVPSAGKRKRNPAVVAHLFAKRIAVGIGRELLKAQIDRLMKLTDLDVVLALSIACVSQAIDFIQQELMDSDMPPLMQESFQTTLGSALKAFTSLPSARTLVQKRRAEVMLAVPRFIGAASTEDRKGACFFSAHQLIAIMLEENAEVRKIVLKSSEEWKSGSLYRSRPEVLSDVIHGTRFLDWREVCGKAAPDEANDIRVVAHGWTDGFTPVDGLSQVARRHKYDVFLATLVNLPLHMRHYVDHVLLLAICNSHRTATCAVPRAVTELYYVSNFTHVTLHVTALRIHVLTLSDTCVPNRCTNGDDFLTLSVACVPNRCTNGDGCCCRCCCRRCLCCCRRCSIGRHLVGRGRAHVHANLNEQAVVLVVVRLLLEHRRAVDVVVRPAVGGGALQDGGAPRVVAELGRPVGHVVHGKSRTHLGGGEHAPRLVGVGRQRLPTVRREPRRLAGAGRRRRDPRRPRLTGVLCPDSGSVPIRKAFRICCCRARLRLCLQLYQRICRFLARLRGLQPSRLRRRLRRGGGALPWLGDHRLLPHSDLDGLRLQPVPVRVRVPVCVPVRVPVHVPQANACTKACCRAMHVPRQVPRQVEGVCGRVWGSCQQGQGTSPSQ